MDEHGLLTNSFLMECDADCKQKFENYGWQDGKFAKTLFNFLYNRYGYEMYQSINNNYTTGWNNSIYLGDLNSNNDYFLLFFINRIEFVDKLELSFNVVLIEPISN